MHIYAVKKGGWGGCKHLRQQDDISTLTFSWPSGAMCGGTVAFLYDHTVAIIQV